MKKLFVIPCIFFVGLLQAQVGIGTVTPEAQLDIHSSNQTAPANNDGILIPKIDEFPVTTPTVAQDGMMVFATGDSSVSKGFYYWDDVLATWVAVGSENGGGDDWYEEGTATAPNNINDEIYKFGNIAIGKNTADYKLDIFENTANNVAYINLAGATNNPTYALTTEITNTGDGEQRGLNTVLNNAGNGTHTGSYVSMNGSGTGETRAFIASVNGNGVGTQRGFYANLNNSSNGDHFGALNVLRGNGDGNHYGINNFLQGNGTGTHFAIRNDLIGTGTGIQVGTRTAISNNGDGNHFAEYNTLSGTGQGFQTGVYNIIDNSGNSNHYGVLNQLAGSGSGIHYGIRSEITGAGTGDQEGVSTLISNTNDANHFGFNTRLNGTGNGSHIGAKFSMSDTGSGFHTGIFTSFTEGTGILTGYWTEFGGNVGSSSQNQIAAYNNYFVGGNGILAGAYTDIRSSVTGTGSHYGTFTANDSPGSGAHYGNFNQMTGTGTGAKYGTYNSIPTATGGVHYGVYSDVQKVGSYAGYFLGTIQGSGRLVLPATTNATGITGSGVIEIGGNLRIDNNEIITNTNTTLSLQSGNTGNLQVANNTFYVNGSLNRVGIGTLTPATSFQVNHPNGITNGLSISNANDADRWHFYILPNSNIMSLYFNGTNVGSFDDVSGTYTPISDRNLKTNISQIEPVLEKVKTLEVVDYNFIDQQTSKKYIGFIAQDVEKLFPQLVKKPSNDIGEESPYMLDYSGFGTIAIKAIQEQQTEIETLKQQLQEQKAELLGLRNLIIGKQ